MSIERQKGNIVTPNLHNLPLLLFKIYKEMGKRALAIIKSENRVKAKLIRDAEIYSKEEFEGGGFIEYPVDGKQNSEEEKNNRETYQLLAKCGHRYRLLPIVKLNHVKNPDAFNLKTELHSDAKHPISGNGFKAIVNSIHAANNQFVQEVVIRFTKVYKRKDLRNGLYNSFKENRSPHIVTVILIHVDGYIEFFDVLKLRNRYESAKGRST